MDIQLLRQMLEVMHPINLQGGTVGMHCGNCLYFEKCKSSYFNCTFDKVCDKWSNNKNKE